MMAKKKPAAATRSKSKRRATPAPIAPSTRSVTSVTSSVDKPPLTVWLFFVFSWSIGWWMAYDGVHQRVTGDYVRLNGQLGPWASLVSAVGIDPFSLGWIFVIVGLGFVAASFGLYLRRRWGYNVGLAASIISLFYLGFGTPMALVCLILLLLRPTRDYLRQAAAM